MEWNIWDASFPEAIQESSYPTRHWWQCDFYYCYGLDMIEEAALNEKSCTEVLKVLIEKADDEVAELEEDLQILKGQLAWADGEWFQLSPAALEEKIACVAMSVQRLKNKNGQDGCDTLNCLEMHREPTERTKDIIMALLSHYFQKKDEQFGDVVSKKSSSEHPEQDNDVLVEEAKVTVVTSAVKQPSYEDIRSFGPNTKKLATGHSKEISRSSSDSNIYTQEITKVSSTSSAPTLDSSLKPEKRKANSNRKQKASAMVKKLLLGNANGSNLERKSSKISTKAAGGKDAKEPFPTHRRKVKGLSPERGGNEAKISKKAKATAVVKSSSLGLPNGSSVERKLSKFNSKATGEKEAKESFPTQRSKFEGLSPEPGGNRVTISKKAKPAGKSLDCGSNGLEEASKHSDKKLEPTNRPEAPQKINFLNSSFKKEDERIEAPKEVKEGEAILIDDEMAAASLLLELLRHGKENKIKRHQMKRQKSVRKAEVYSMDEDCDSDSTLTLQIQQLRKCQSNPDSVKEPCLSAELGLVSFSKAKYKRKGKAGMGDRNSSNGKIKKRKAPDGGLNSLSLADKKRKLCPSLPVQEETKELKGLESPTELEGLTDSTTEEELKSPKCFSTDGSDTEAVNALPSTATLVDPLGIAKQYKLKRYSKLRKADHAKQLGSLLNDIGTAKEPATRKSD